MGAASVIGGWTSSLPEKSVHSLELRLAKCWTMLLSMHGLGLTMRFLNVITMDVPTRRVKE